MEYREAVAEMEYREAVAESRQLDTVIEEAETTADGARWRQAQLTHEQIEAGVSKAQWARDIGKDESMVRRWSQMWQRWGSGPRPGFTEAYSIIRGRDAQVEEYGSQRAFEARTRVRNLPPEEKAEVVREALAEPEVAERIVRDTPTRTRLAKAEHSVDREQQEVARERYELAEPRSVQIGAMADAEYALTKIRTAADDAREAVDKLIAYDWPDDSKERTEVLVQRAAAAVELVRAKIEGRDLDQELQALLESGEG